MTGRLIDLTIGRNRKQRVTVELDEDFRAEYDDLNGVDLDVTLKKHRQRRSLDANAYAWVLMDKLASKLGTSKADVYRTAIRDIGGVSETVCVVDKAADKLRRGWERHGLGWQKETFESKLPGCTNVTLYYGSSEYDTRQMSALIDHLVQDCKAQGIETLPPERLAAMTEAWK